MSALRTQENPRLRLGMTGVGPVEMATGARNDERREMTKGDGRERQAVGGVAKIRNAR
jgi:hypothetical protein